MKLPRNVYGADLVKALRIYGYEASRQRGSHIRVTTQINGTHHEVIPAHKPIKLITASFPDTPRVHYAELRPELRTGDQPARAEALDDWVARRT